MDIILSHLHWHLTFVTLTSIFIIQVITFHNVYTVNTVIIIPFPPNIYVYPKVICLQQIQPYPEGSQSDSLYLHLRLIDCKALLNTSVLSGRFQEWGQHITALLFQQPTHRSLSNGLILICLHTLVLSGNNNSVLSLMVTHLHPTFRSQHSCTQKSERVNQLGYVNRCSLNFDLNEPQKSKT